MARPLHRLIHQTGSIVHDRSSIEQVVELLSDAVAELATPEQLGTRWDEAVQTFRSGRTTWDKRIWAIDRLREACAQADRDATFLPLRMRGILNDSMIDVQEARGEPLGGPYNDARELARRKAGLTLDERLRLCRDVVARAPTRRDCVVWLIYANARLGTSAPLAFENVTFFDGHLLTSLMQGESPDERLPIELRSPWMINVEDFAGDIVGVRVELVDQPVESAAETAVETAQALVRYASLYSRWVWKLRRGHKLFIHDQWAGGWFESRLVSDHDPDAQNPQAKFWVAEELGHRTAGLARRLAPGHTQGVETADLLRRVELIIDATAEVRALLAPRLIERVSRLVDGHADWPRFLKERMRADWSLNKLTQIVDDDIVACVNSDLASLRADVFDEASLSVVEQELSDDGEFRFAEACSRLDELAELFVRGSSRATRLHDSAIGTADGQAVGEWLSRLEQEFDVLVARLERSRHALVHSWPVQPVALETVSGFAAHLAVQAVHLVADGVVSGGSFQAGFASAAGRAASVRTRLEGATRTDIGRILFDSAGDVGGTSTQ